MGTQGEFLTLPARRAKDGDPFLSGQEIQTRVD
jgi:hypothetical protein